MRTLNARRCSLAAALALATCSAWASDPAATVQGVVKDEAGRPLTEVKVQVCGMERLNSGTWTREFKLGWMPSYATDKEGRFAIPFHQQNVACDIYFDKVGYAPTFLYRISNSAPELSVVMKRGMRLAGTVKREVAGKLEPVREARVELLLPSADLAYQQRTLTDEEGRYVFAVAPPPAGRKWRVVSAGEDVQVEVKEGEPVIGPNFEVAAKAVGGEKGRAKGGVGR